MDASSPADQESFERVLASIARGSLEHFGKLSPSARAYFLALAEPLLREAGGDMAALEALYAVDYERIPPTPQAFLDEEDYAHEAAKDLFPAWRPVIQQACDPANGIYEINITGASGLGKTTAAMFIFGYKLTRLFCLRDPAAFYGLSSRSKIYCGLYAITKKLIKQVGFYDLRDKILDQSPFFRYLYPRMPHGSEYIRWNSKNIEVITGSSELHAIGRSLFMVAADELNYYAQGDKTTGRAHELVAEVSRRLEGRFVQQGGDIPGVAIYISQTRTTSDYLERRFKEKKGTKGVMCVRGPRWAFNPLGYSNDRNRGFRPDLGDPCFRVFVGNDVADPRVLDRVVTRDDGSTFVEPVDPDDAVNESIINVPIVHYRAFLDDLHGALRNVADVPSGSFTPFFSRREIVEVMFDEALSNPFSRQAVPCFEGSDQELKSFFDGELVLETHMGHLQPKRHPEASRYVHLDLAHGGEGNDRASIVMVHSSGHYYDEHKPELEDPVPVSEGEIVKNIEVDFYVALEGGTYGEQIDYRKVRVFLDWLRNAGYRIRLVTCDSYQSTDMLQRLRENNFLAEIQSVDRTSQPYRDLRQSMSEGRLTAPWPRGLLRFGDMTPEEERRAAIEEALTRVILYQELTGLEHDVKHDKIDHRAQNPDGSKGSKDIADGLAGAVFRCLTDAAVAPGGKPGRRPTARQTVANKLNRYLPKVR